MNGATGTQLGPNWDHPTLTLLTTTGLIGTCLPRASRSHPALGTPGTLPSPPLPGDQRGTHAMSFRYTKSSRAERRVAPSPALVTFTGTPAEAGRENGQDQPVSGSPPGTSPRGR